MPIYEYQHPETGEIFEEFRLIKNRNKVFIAPDGVKCKRIMSSQMGYCGLAEKEREVFQLDSNYAKKMNPKYVKFRDGHRERYDPNKHF